MGLADRMEELLKSQRPIGSCSYKLLYESLSTEEKKALDEAIKQGYSQNIIIRALRAEGYKCSADTMRAHFKGQCKCPKE
jgi:cell division inhibitor SulA